MMTSNTTSPKFNISVLNKEEVVCNQFCSEKSKFYCNDTVFLSCPECNIPAIVAMEVVLILVGLLSIAGNTLIIAVAIQKFQNNSAAKLDIIKASLAIVNLLFGVQIFAVLLEKFVAIYSSTGYEYYFLSPNTSNPIGCGFIMMLCVFGSLYHLLYLGGIRFFSVLKPLKYAITQKISVYIGIGIVWLLTFFSATVPVWKPDDGIYYCGEAYICFVCGKNFQDFHDENLYVVLAFVVPFVAMTLLATVTAVLSYKKLHNFSKITDASRHQHNTYRQQHEVFKTIAIMQIGFTITIAPVIINYVLHFYITNVNGNCLILLDIPLAGCILTTANSITNPLVYLIRDKGFRNSIGDIFKTCKTKLKC